MAGRKPKSNILKLLDGNPGERPIWEEPRPAPSELDPPAGLSDGAAAIWRAEASDLIRVGILTSADRRQFAILCEALVDYARIRAEYLETGDTVPAGDSVKPNPLYGLMHKTREHVIKLSAEFGLSPTSRVRLAVKPSRAPNRFTKI
jgi:P27 family predicted phage terminase small subunit